MDFLLAAALCADTLFVCISYGASGIRIPALSRIILSAVPAACFALSLAIGSLIASYIQPLPFRLLGFLYSFCWGCKVSLVQKSVPHSAADWIVASLST